MLLFENLSSISLGLIPGGLLCEELFSDLRIRHSRMLLSGIQARPELDPRLKHSGVTPLG
jgi:hypothetical protein